MTANDPGFLTPEAAHHAAVQRLADIASEFVARRNGPAVGETVKAAIEYTESEPIPTQTLEQYAALIGTRETGRVIREITVPLTGLPHFHVNNDRSAQLPRQENLPSAAHDCDLPPMGG